MIAFVVGLAAAVALVVMLQTRGASLAPDPRAARRRIDEELQLSGGSGTIGPCSVVVRVPDERADDVTQITVNAAIPWELAIEREGAFESNDWHTGDRELDRVMKLGVNQAVYGFALGVAQRRLLMQLIAPNVQFSVDARRFRIEVRDSHASEVVRLTRTAIELMTFWAAPPPSMMNTVLENAKHDPLPPIRAVAVALLSLNAPLDLERHLDALRADHDPQVRFAIALHTRKADDIRNVPLDAFADKDLRRLWDRCVDALDGSERRKLAEALLALTASETDALRYASVFDARDEMLRLLRHRHQSVRLRAVSVLAELGDLEVIPTLRALEQSAPLARAQVKACREAIIRIQRGAGVIDSGGALSTDTLSDRGALSVGDRGE